MIEPTESEDLGELDRFIDAMIAIREETLMVRDGVWPLDDNPLANAPHTASCAMDSEWAHPYSRETAVYPAEMRSREGHSFSRQSLAGAPSVASKYWPPVRRVDQAFGDRNLVCACPPIEAFA
jgi:glycine dehydrogenase